MNKNDDSPVNGVMRAAVNAARRARSAYERGDTNLATQQWELVQALAMTAIQVLNRDKRKA